MKNLKEIGFLILLICIWQYSFGQKTTLALFGDTQALNSNAKTVIYRAASFNPDITLLAGDLCEHGSNQWEWDTLHSWLNASGLYSEPNNSFYSCPGGHDFHGLTSTNRIDYENRWKPQFDLPGEEFYYSVKRNNVFCINLWIDFVSMDIVPYSIGGEQWKWAMEELKRANADPEVEWIIVMWHIPPSQIASGTSGAPISMPYWMQLVEMYNVDFVLNGHQHIYHRTHPVIYDGGRITVDSASGKGVVYLAAAAGDIGVAGGAPFYYDAVAVSNNNRSSVPGYKGNPIIKLEIEGLTAHFYGINGNDGTIFDTKVYTKHPKSPNIQLSSKPLSRGYLSFCPNPFTSYTLINLPFHPHQMASINIYAISGKKVDALKSNSAALRWNPNSLPSAYYIVNANVAGKTYTKKVLYKK